MRGDVEVRSHPHRSPCPRGAHGSSRRSLSPRLRPRALLRGAGALRVLRPCSARSPISVLGGSVLHLEELARLQLSKHARDLNAVEKRFGARGRIFRFLGPSVSTSRGGIARIALRAPRQPTFPEEEIKDAELRPISLRGAAHLARSAPASQRPKHIQEAQLWHRRDLVFGWPITTSPSHLSPALRAECRSPTWRIAN